MKRNYAVVLAGGKGSRMGMDTPKQYIDVNGHPLLYYSLKTFQDCDFIDGIVLVTLALDIDFCRENIVQDGGFDKVENIVAGGRERYESVYNGLSAIKDGGYVFIHDGARPCINLKLLQKLYGDVQKYGASVAAVRSKDTVKISDSDGFVKTTPDRTNVWIIQTPQVFDTERIKAAYGAMYSKPQKNLFISDDATVMERYGECRVHLCEASYSNIKVTTPEDIFTVENFLKNFSVN